MKTSLHVEAFTTRIFRTGEKLADFVVEHLPRPPSERPGVLAVTSKIVSLAERRLVAKSEIEKHDLVRREADHDLGEVGYGCYLTVKHGLFIPSAGIDESNSESGAYILYPEDPFASARALWSALRERWKVRELGILLTDSHTTPLRRGVTGISLAHWGFRGLDNKVGQSDLFGRNLKMTTVNVADALATSATLLMGEANECRPLAWLENSAVVFADTIDPSEVKISLEEDLYYPVFKGLIR